MRVALAAMAASAVAGPALATASFDAGAYGRLDVVSNVSGAAVSFSASAFDDYSSSLGEASGSRNVDAAVDSGGLTLDASVSGVSVKPGRSDAAALADGYVFLSNPEESSAVVSFVFFYELSSSISAGSIIQQAAAMAVARIDPLSGAEGAGFFKESYASGVFQADMDTNAGSYGFDVALAPFSTASFALYVDAMGYVDFAGYSVDAPNLPSVPVPAAGGLAAFGFAALGVFARRRQARG